MVRYPDFDVSYRRQKTTTGGSIGITSVKELSTGEVKEFIATRVPKGYAIDQFKRQRLV
jgi:hypothetical protein